MHSFRKAIDALSEAVEIATLGGRVLYTNPAHGALFGRQPADTGPAPVPPLTERLSDDSVQLWRRRILPGLQRGESWMGELSILLATGGAASIRACCDIISDEAGTEPLLIVTFSQRGEDDELARSLREAKNLAEAANRAKSQFLASMSHELRTPLNAILGFSQLLQLEIEQPLAPKQREHLDHILTAGRLLMSLIDEILDLSKIESGATEVDLGPVVLINVLDECVSTLTPLADERGVRIAVSNQTSPNTAVQADRDRLLQVLINLGSNAIKYNRDTDPRLTVRIEDHGDSVRFSFVDTGVGIPADQIEALFEPFNRLGAEGGGIKGTGIGLTIAKRLIELMGGKIGVISQPGEGSNFWIDLPRAETAQGEGLTSVVRLDRSRVAAPKSSKQGTTILHIENDEANRALMRDVAERLPNLRLIGANNAIDGLIEARAEKPDLILLNLRMTSASGIDPYTLLQEDPVTSEIPVIGISAAPGAMAGIDQLGLSGLVESPLDLDALVSAVNGAIERGQNGE